MGSAQTFNEIRMAAPDDPTDYASGYRVEVSPNGSAWSVAATCTGTGTPEIVSFPAQTDQYVEVVLNGSTPDRLVVDGVLRRLPPVKVLRRYGRRHIRHGAATRGARAWPTRFLLFAGGAGVSGTGHTQRRPPMAGRVIFEPGACDNSAEFWAVSQTVPVDVASYRPLSHFHR